MNKEISITETPRGLLVRSNTEVGERDVFGAILALIDTLEVKYDLCPIVTVTILKEVITITRKGD